MSKAYQEAKSLLATYINTYQSWAWSHAAFFLLSGFQWVGKTELALECIQELLGPYMQSSLLHIKDFSQVLGKKHSIKVEENTTNKDYSTLLKEHSYKDIWVREMTTWLSQSGFWPIKVLLIENIERMSIWATNAFLKSCEEPLPNKIIIATTANKWWLLDTILSRSMIVPVGESTIDEMRSFAMQNNISINNTDLQELLIMMAMGRPRVLLNLFQGIQDDEELAETLNEIMKYLPHPWHVFKKYSLLNKIFQAGIGTQFVDAWIAYTESHWLHNESRKRIKFQKMFNSNTKEENLILYCVLD